MKNSFKERAQSLAIGAVECVTLPTHMGLILGGNLVKATTDFVADKVAALEGAIVHQIDKGRESDLVSQSRRDFTDAKMGEAAEVIGRIHMKLNRSVIDMKESMKESLSNIGKATGAVDDYESKINGLNFHLASLREQIDLISKETNIHADEKADLLKNLRMDLARTSKELKKVMLESNKSIEKDKEDLQTAF